MSTHSTLQERPPVAASRGPGPGDGAVERDLPEPARLRRLIGPSVILVGVGVASGEYILFPYIASKAGLAFLWAAVVGVAVQFFINMEIERYTLATGQTAITGFQRLWKPWGLILVLMALLATSWPGWATSAATVSTFLFGGGDASVIAVGALLAIGVTLTASPVVYQTVERLEFLKVGALLLFIVIALFAAVSSTAYSDTSQTITSFGTFPSEIELAILVGALAAAGAGGANNLVQSNWIRDKGFGMGRYAPRIVSPITGEEEAAPSGQRYSFPRDEENMARWREWWRRANLEQFLSFARGRRRVDQRLLADRVLDRVRQPGPAGLERLRLHRARGRRARRAGRRLVRHAVPRDRRGQPVRRGAGDRRLRLAPRRRRRAGRLHVRQRALDREPRLLRRRLDDDRVRHAILLAGFDQPLVLVTISTVLGGFIMFVYSCLLVVTNRRYLPEELKLRGYRLGIIAFAIALLGVTSAIVGVDQFGNLF